MENYIKIIKLKNEAPNYNFIFCNIAEYVGNVIHTIADNTISIICGEYYIKCYISFYIIFFDVLYFIGYKNKTIIKIIT